MERISFAFYHLFYYLWEMCHFEYMHLVCYVLRSIVRREWGRELCHMFALVEFWIDEMNSDARHCFASGFHCFMHMMSPHALAAKLRE